MKKRKNTAAVLSLFLGGIGIQKFYLGQSLRGVLSLLFCWTYIPLLIGLYDFVFFLVMQNAKFDYLYNNQSPRKCSACDSEINKDNKSYWGARFFKEEGMLCKSCFTKIRYYNKTTGKYDFTQEELQKIIQTTEDTLKSRPLPKSKIEKPIIPEFDEEFEIPEEIEGFDLHILVQIDYKDSNGNKSTRRITIKHIYSSSDNDYYLESYCHEREAHRTFKLSRASNMVDVETGEIIENASKYFTDRFNDSPIGIITKLFQEFESQILTMVYMARADGYLRKKEREIIVNFIHSKTKKNIDLVLVENEIRRTHCNNSSLRQALKSLKSKSPEDKNELISLVERIIHTDKNIDPMELGALELIKRELKTDV